MAVGSLVGQAMLVFSIMIISAIMLANYNDYSINTMSLFESEKTENLISTKGDITITGYNISESSLNISMMNTGKITINDIADFEMYVDGARIQNSKKFIRIISSTDITNPGIFDLKEELMIETNGTYETGSHTVTIASSEGIKTSTIVALN
ncbi:hypothetical protein H6503_02845 [Candidatus Woesearchaeota archaeon]|nr:hypothetical protein [Candidatus Woesearchaeota archaeon]